MDDIFKLIFGAIAGPLFFVAGIIMIYFTLSFFGLDLEPIASVAIALTPIWLPVSLFYILFDKWMEYAELKFKLDMGRTTLRVKLPQEVFKSPEAMESVFAQIHNPNGCDNLWDAYIDGKHALPFSFELVSHGGEVRFYINVPKKKIKNAVEAQLYAQYPGVEVVEEELDYTAEVKWDPKQYEMMAFHVVKKEEEVFPIKTYIDYGLDRMPKEEEKFEPMAPMLEALGKAKPTDRLWIQIIATPHAKRNFKSGSLSEKTTWESKVKKKIDEMLGRDEKKKAEADGREEQARLTAGERDNIAAMERNASKYAYEVGIRAIYLSKADTFDGELIGPMLKSFSQYDMLGRNGLGVRWRTDFDYNWLSDFSGKKKLKLKKKELEAYKKREYSKGDKKGGADSTKVMSVEELATIYHIPGKAIVTPALPRITSTRKEAPSNLPIGLPTNL